MKCNIILTENNNYFISMFLRDRCYHQSCPYLFSIVEFLLFAFFPSTLDITAVKLHLSQIATSSMPQEALQGSR